TQVFNNTLLSKKEVSLDNIEAVNVLNPLSDKMTHLRTSLIQSLLKTADFNNNNGKKDLMLFELGNVFNKTGVGLNGINETFQLSAITLGKMINASVHQNYHVESDFFIIKGAIKNLLDRLHIGKSELDIEHNNIKYEKSFLINLNKKTIGHYGKISPKISKNLDLDILDIFAFEINLDIVIKMMSQSQLSYNPIIYYPKVERDINFVLDEKIEIGKILETIHKNNYKILNNVLPQNIFRHESLGNNKKSVTFNFVFQHPSKTLEDKDVNLVINEIINVVSKNFSAKLR
ncbi:MAG: hypothetical protein VX887_03160, partial [Candidatus Neomarinimicrobiota bacterium]|nr:hypothetical protein [Candidatus Neomarinimicrobiota bacterium]